MERKLSNRFRDIEEIRSNWVWFLALGVLLAALGFGLIGSSVSATLFSVTILGVLLLGAGIVQIIQAFLSLQWSGFFLSLILGILYIVVGFFCATRPAEAAISLTLWIAIFFFIIGLFRMLVSLLLRYEEWGWSFFNGLITFLLGVSIYAQWPYSGLWVIGLFVGVDMILSGWSWIVLSLAARK